MILRKEARSDGLIHFCGTTYSSENVEIQFKGDTAQELYKIIIDQSKDGKEAHYEAKFSIDDFGNIDDISISADNNIDAYSESKLKERLVGTYEQLKSTYNSGSSFIECEDISVIKPVDAQKRIIPTNPQVSQNSFSVLLNNEPGTNQIAIQIVPAIEGYTSCVYEHGHLTADNRDHPDFRKYNVNPDSELYVDLIKLLEIQQAVAGDLNAESKTALRNQFDTLFIVAGGNSPTGTLVHEIKPDESNTQVLLEVIANNGNNPDDSYWKKLANGDTIGFWKDLGIDVRAENNKIYIAKGPETVVVDRETNELLYTAPWGNEYCNCKKEVTKKNRGQVEYNSDREL